MTAPPRSSFVAISDWRTPGRFQARRCLRCWKGIWSIPLSSMVRPYPPLSLSFFLSVHAPCGQPQLTQPQNRTQSLVLLRHPIRFPLARQSRSPVVAGCAWDLSATDERECGGIGTLRTHETRHILACDGAPVFARIAFRYVAKGLPPHRAVQGRDTSPCEESRAPVSGAWFNQVTDCSQRRKRP